MYRVEKLDSIVANLEVRKENVKVKINLTENGKININILSSPKYDIYGDYSENFNETYTKLKGKTKDGTPIVFDKTFVTYDIPGNVDSIKPLEIKIDGSNEFVSQKNEDVQVTFDVLCQKFPSDKEIELIEKKGWKATGIPLSDIEDRLKHIEEFYMPLYTGKIRINQCDITGNISYQFEKAEKRLEKLLELSGFAQGVGPSYIKAKLESIEDNDKKSEEKDIKYIKYYSTHSNLGGCFKNYNLVNIGNLSRYFNEAYDKYNNHVRNDLHLNMVIDYYLDSINLNRSIEGRLLSVCSAIELLAKRYADFNEISTKTIPKIDYLVDKLDVKSSDLTESSGTYKNEIKSTTKKNDNDFLTKLNNIISKYICNSPNKKSSKNYFYSYSRQYVVHGDNNPTWDELTKDYFAALTLLQRIIRNQLVESYETYGKLRNISPNKKL